MRVASSFYTESYVKSRLAGICASYLETVYKLPFVRGPSAYPFCNRRVMDEIDGCFSETLGRSIVMDIETSIETPASRAAPQSSDGGDLLEGRVNVG